MNTNPSNFSQSLDLAVIGNGQISALINHMGTIQWCCLPRFDSDPLFNALLQQSNQNTTQNILSQFAIELVNFQHAKQYYLPNTAIVITDLYDNQNNILRITDLCPRFRQHDRMFHPAMIVRQLQPIQGTPRIQIKLNPTANWGKTSAQITFGSNHIRYILNELVVRLTTDLSLTYIMQGTTFFLERPASLILGPDETLLGSIHNTSRNFVEQTQQYWQQWSRSLHIPFEWQREVIRAAITLKLNAYEDTGAILAAMTTSIPESEHSGRNWDYRYCWLRDAFFVVNALNRLGRTKTMENYLRYIINIVANSDAQKPLQPVYKIDGLSQIEETVINHLPGYQGMGPVRKGNDAYSQIQNDVYGSVILATAHGFFDSRLIDATSSRFYNILEQLGEQAYHCFQQPDAGLWEFRNTNQVHTYSSVMCWAACDRLAKIGHHLKITKSSTLWQQRAAQIHQVICQQAWNTKLNSFTESFNGTTLDASLLLLPELGFISYQDPRFISTMQQIEEQLLHDQFIYRYIKADDFGIPKTAFIICTFWYINALAALGRTDEARDLFNKMLDCTNAHGLLAEDIDPRTKILWGNYPQTYSLVGLIQCALRLSKPWDESY